MNKLALVAITGITISAVCLGAGGALEGRDFHGLNSFSIFDRGPRCDAATDGGATSRDLDWDGADHVTLTAPGHVTYAPGSDDRMHVSGDARLVAHVRARGGRVELDCHGWQDGDNLTIALPGREFDKFTIAGTGHLALNGLKQDHIKLSIKGSGSIKADGKVETADLHIGGSGDINIAAVQAAVAKVDIRGSGNTDIAPTDEADIHIAGSGDVNLHTNPKKLETHIAGSGRIHNIPAGG
jgi:hypothetical protein